MLRFKFPVVFALLLNYSLYANIENLSSEEETKQNIKNLLQKDYKIVFTNKKNLVKCGFWPVT